MNELRCAWEHHPNKSLATLHISERLFTCDRYGGDSDKLSKAERALVEALSQVPGVKDIGVGPYEVSVRRGAVFAWKEIQPRVEVVVARWTGLEAVKTELLGPES